MKKLDTIISFIFTKYFYHKAFAYGIFILFLIFFQSFALVFFLTFIFAYLFYSSSKFIKSKLDDLVCSKINNINHQKYFLKYFSVNFIIIFEYLIFVFLLFSIVSSAIPKLQTELTGLAETIPVLQDQLNNIKIVLSNINSNYTEIGTTVKEAFSSSDYNVFINIFDRVKDAGLIILQIFFSLILSLVFLLDRKKLKKYLAGIKKSNFAFLYNEYKIIFDKIIRSFGLILKAQSLIALVNAVLTVIGLFIIGTVFIPGIGFPYLLTLGLVVFIFGFVPVVGVFLSSIPIVIVGFSYTGGLPIVLSIIGLIIIIHTIEAYYLNPKIVSNFLELPVSLTFVVLFIGEHLFGIAGLLIGVSLFYFIMSIFRDIDKAITRKHRIKKLENTLEKRIKESV